MRFVIATILTFLLLFLFGCSQDIPAPYENPTAINIILAAMPPGWKLAETIPAQIPWGHNSSGTDKSGGTKLILVGPQDVEFTWRDSSGGWHSEALAKESLELWIMPPSYRNDPLDALDFHRPTPASLIHSDSSVRVYARPAHRLVSEQRARLAGRTYFLYDGTTPVVEMEASGALTATNTFGAHGLVSRYRNGFGSRIFYTFDAQGSVAQRLDLYGNVLSSRSYTAHGMMMGKGVADPFGYKARWGYYTDTETGLLLLTHRYYDPGTGRFLTRDPIGYAGGINLYAYTQNNPINGIDPLGLDTTIIIWNSVGYGESSFGHVSVIINGTSYSWGPAADQTLGGHLIRRRGVMNVGDAADYLNRNTAFRSGTGYHLNITAAEEQSLQDFLNNYQGRYGLISNNCTDPLSAGLRHIGHGLGNKHILLPRALADALGQRRGQLVDGVIRYRQGTGYW
ncbi:MAG: RHS repeat-associated core domain-containing protein [Acidobacteria bacterium]|nr:RHS repeat-associated core domain-containing protein [Acidobacteriota bacterium]